MDRHRLLTLVTLASGVSAVSPVWVQFDLGKMLDAGKDLARSESLTDEEVKSSFDQMAAESDRQNRIAAAGSPYAARLSKLAAGLGSYEGLNMNFKVYLTPNINAFAMANGTIRVNSGLIDQFTDDEVRYVIGHVKKGHSKARAQAALRTSALRNAVSASNSRAGAIANSQLGDLFEKVVRAQHSQSNEREADDYRKASVAATGSTTP